MRLRTVLIGFCAVAAALVVGVPSRAEVVEEIVAWVNGEIITKSDLEAEEQLVTAEAYRSFSGEELDRRLEERLDGLLIDMINRKVLVSYARRLFDVEKMYDAYLRMFKEQQGVESDEEIEKMLAQDGMTVADLKERLLEMLAPEDVIRNEVGGRLAVGDAEVETYYQEHPDEFKVPAEVTLREIVLLADSANKREERREQAERVRERASSEDFEALAREVSEAGTRDSGGLLGPLKKGELSAALEEPAFSLPVGTVSAVIELPHGFHIIKVESRQEAGLRPMDEVREPLRRFLEDKHFRTARHDFLEKARAESEWCVKRSYLNRLSVDASTQTCEGI